MLSGIKIRINSIIPRSAYIYDEFSALDKLRNLSRKESKVSSLFSLEEWVRIYLNFLENSPFCPRSSFAIQLAADSIVY